MKREIVFSILAGTLACHDTKPTPEPPSPRLIPIYSSALALPDVPGAGLHVVDAEEILGTDSGAALGACMGEQLEGVRRIKGLVKIGRFRMEHRDLSPIAASRKTLTPYGETAQFDINGGAYVYDHLWVASRSQQRREIEPIIDRLEGRVAVDRIQFLPSGTPVGHWYGRLAHSTLDEGLPAKLRRTVSDVYFGVTFDAQIHVRILVKTEFPRLLAGLSRTFGIGLPAFPQTKLTERMRAIQRIVEAARVRSSRGEVEITTRASAEEAIRLMGGCLSSPADAPHLGH